MKYFIKTFGCQQNGADSQRVASAFQSRGMTEGTSYEDTNYVVINTCMVKESAENRVFGLVENLAKIKEEKLKKGEQYKIIVTGCMVGVAFRDKSGKYLDKIRRVMPEVDEFMPIEEVGFNLEPVRINKKNAWVPISNGCNNFCTFCIVPFTRGREISRPYEDIIAECKRLRQEGYTSVMLLGQNVNSYGADLLLGEKNIQVMRDIDTTYFETGKSEELGAKNQNKVASKDKVPTNGIAAMSLENHLGHPKGGTHRDFTTDHSKMPMDTQLETPKFYRMEKELKPVYVKHLNRYRIPTLFPYLLEEVAKMGFEKVDFMSSNPWDFSDELIDVIAKNPNITRTLHIAVQSGSNRILKKMNRWHTAEDFKELIDKMKSKIPGIQFTTDIIVGFCGETDEDFKATIDICNYVDFQKAFISRYSQRPMTAATKVFDDDVPAAVKKTRWDELDAIVNKPKLAKYQTS